jgi:hypothetical protein
MPEPSVGARSLYPLAYMPSERTFKRLMWRDDMENSPVVKWQNYSGAAVCTYDNADKGAFEGDYVLKITSVNTDCTARPLHGFGRMPPGIHAVELRWLNDANVQDRIFQFWDSDFVGQARRMMVRWASNRWQYESSLNVFTDIPDGEEYIGNNSWNYLRIVADFRNLLYRRLVTSYLDINLTSLSLPMIPCLATSAGWTDIQLQGQTSAVDQARYYDDVRLYQDDELED